MNSKSSIQSETVRNRYFVACATLIFGLIGSAASGSARVPEVLTATHATTIFREFDRNRTLAGPACDAKNSDGEFDAKSFFAKQSCAVLLSINPPEWIRNRPDHAFFAQPDNWFPVCSAAEFGKHEDDAHPARSSALLNKVESALDDTDGCADPTQNRSSKDFHQPSQNEMGETKLSAVEKHKLLDTFKVLQTTVAEKCCGDRDSQCTDLMNNVAVSFCKAQKNPNTPDPCVGDGTYYTPDFDDHWQQNKLGKKSPDELKKLIVGKFELKPGTITLSPLTGEDNRASYTHELGHACSQIRRKLAIYRGSVEEFQDYLSPSTCKITPASEITYTRLFQSLGLNVETMNCIEKNAQGLKKKRFLKGNCAKGCPYEGLDESYADSMSLLATPVEQWVPDQIPDYQCHAMRDSTHILGADSLRCFMMSPNLKSTVETALGCQK
jgi:hypothetical protein